MFRRRPEKTAGLSIKSVNRLLFGGPQKQRKKDKKRKGGRPRLRGIGQLVEWGMDGALQDFLNGLPALKKALERRGGSLGSIGDPEHLLRLFKTWGWPGLQYGLIWDAPAAEHSLSYARSRWKDAIAESVLFAKWGFTPIRCAHKSHWFISDDSRRKDCPRHRRAGWQKRWKEKKRVKARKVAAERTRAL